MTPNSATISTVNNRTYITYPINVTVGVTFPMLFTIISVEGGKVKSVAWDNFCHWCKSDRCAQNTVNYDARLVMKIGSNCYLPDTDCFKYNGVGNITSNQLCELTVSLSLFLLSRAF